MTDNTTPETILIYKFTASMGKRHELPFLDAGEFGFTTDTGQIYIGADIDDSFYVDPKVIRIYPINNAKNIVQNYLLQNTNYQFYIVNEDLSIVTESNEKALEICQYINDTNAERVGQYSRPIAGLEANIEIITNLNIHDYINPGDLVVNKTPIDQYGTISKSLLSKSLQNINIGIFLEYTFDDFFSIDVEYFLTQRDNSGTIVHKRKGKISATVDSSSGYTGDISFNDAQTLLQSYNNDSIRFDVDTMYNQFRINFIQPISHTTQIYYRVHRWNITE